MFLLPVIERLQHSKEQTDILKEAEREYSEQLYIVLIAKYIIGINYQ